MATVVITGGSRGIGAATVRRFAARGDRVFFFYEKAHDRAKALEEETGATGICCDVAREDSVREAFLQIPQVDILICCAGISQVGLFQDVTPEAWDRMFDVNVKGIYHTVRQAIPYFLKQQKGCILTLSSMWGQVGASCEAAYSAAKAGVIGLGRALAKEVGPSGVTVNCVAPGVVETDMMAGFSAEDKAALAEETPVGRLGTPEEVARALVFLAGPDSDFITGQVLGVNGGLVI